LSEYLEANFVPSVVPQPDEYAAKEQARQYLEKLVERISPGAKLLPFGSVNATPTLSWCDSFTNPIHFALLCLGLWRMVSL
jgi:hypothetical protein